MTPARRFWLAFCALLALLAGLFPPWTVVIFPSPRTLGTKYAFLFSPPERGLLALKHLFFIWLLTSFLAAAGWLLLGPRSSAAVPRDPGFIQRKWAQFRADAQGDLKVIIAVLSVIAALILLNFFLP
jgi:hypothetical protein